MPLVEPTPLVVPDYAGACVANVLPAALAAPAEAPGWLPAAARGAPQVVLLVLDGLGWEQLRERPHLAPNLSGMAGGPITTVAPSTTAAALCSITLGCPPARHGVLGYRLRVAGSGVLNVLRWRTAEGDARAAVPPEAFQPVAAFGGQPVPVVTRAEFATTGFSVAHLAGARLVGWRVSSSIAVEVGRLLRGGERLVYAYYDGVDKVAHEYGFGDHYDAEVRAADRLVGELADVLPPDAALVVTSDHGQVEVGDACLQLDAEVMQEVDLLSGEARFRWLHVPPGGDDRAVARTAKRAEAAYGDLAWVRTREEVLDEGWFGGPVPEPFASRLGDVALVAREPVAFVDPADTGPVRLRCRHGSLTPAEMLVPLLAVRG